MPKLILIYYGSEANGLVSSITHFLSFISLAECGIGVVIQSSLYRPLAEKNDEEISKIIVSSDRFFRKVGIILAVYIVIMVGIYPSFIAPQYDFLYVVSLLLAISISTFIQYYACMSYRLLLNADQAVYVNLSLSIVSGLVKQQTSEVVMKSRQFIQKTYKHFYSRLSIKLREKVFENRLKYVHIKKKSNKTLLIIFSGISKNKPVYNYYFPFKNLDVSRLYILDDFGTWGGYYLFDNGSNKPEILTTNLIRDIISKNGYSEIITAGSSKGGTAAIYYGLKFNAKHIFAGACQYLLGNYLNREDHIQMFKEMMGEEDTESNTSRLNNIIRNQLIANRDNHGVIHLLYSKNELTYERNILPLINDLNEIGYKYEERIEHFTNHSDVGLFFGPAFIEWFNLYINETGSSLI